MPKKGNRHVMCGKGGKVYDSFIFGLLYAFDALLPTFVNKLLIVSVEKRKHR
jgi:hypothetical protein